MGTPRTRSDVYVHLVTFGGPTAKQPQKETKYKHQKKKQLPKQFHRLANWEQLMEDDSEEEQKQMAKRKNQNALKEKNRNETGTHPTTSETL